ncbi:MAG: NUDIX domain-containing protein [Candidatus Dojkabacteria bacterium]|nr:MAG: NUDIX domain-containing protein [Candidatus Dojkabacteria bacterium]
MENINIKLHDFQKQILGKLSHVVDARFNDLLIEGLESEHMNYHLKKLIDLGMVEKSQNKYRLTDKGKDCSNMMDDNVEFIERQPKTSVLLRILRKNDEGVVEQLVCRRLRQPYYGKVGRLTGKVRFGEELEEAARRELYEETGLLAKAVILENVYHKLRHNVEGEYLQDNLFYRFLIKDTYGNLITKTPHQENFWINVESFDPKEYDMFDDFELMNNYEPDILSFSEINTLAQDY